MVRSINGLKNDGIKSYRILQPLRGCQGKKQRFFLMTSFNYVTRSVARQFSASLCTRYKKNNRYDGNVKCNTRTRGTPRPYNSLHISCL